MKWQNLIKKECPKCGEKLHERKDKAVLYECDGCDFLISRRKYFEILTDEKHIIRNYLTPTEVQKIEEALIA